MESSHSQGLLPPVSLGLAIHHRAWCKRSLIVQSPEQRKNCEFEVGNGCGRSFKQKAKQINKQTNKQTGHWRWKDGGCSAGHYDNQPCPLHTPEAQIHHKSKFSSATLSSAWATQSHGQSFSISTPKSIYWEWQPRTPPLVPWKHS